MFSEASVLEELGVNPGYDLADRARLYNRYKESCQQPLPYAEWVKSIFKNSLAPNLTKV
jgi:hypothetical protein